MTTDRTIVLDGVPVTCTMEGGHAGNGGDVRADDVAWLGRRPGDRISARIPMTPANDASDEIFRAELAAAFALMDTRRILAT